MKTAYELAMERLSKSSPITQLNEEQKKEIAELDSKYKAKFAEREIMLNGEMEKALNTGDFEAVEQLKKQLASAKKTLDAELEEKKEKIRQTK